jgi:hypothetical protein
MTSSEINKREKPKFIIEKDMILSTIIAFRFAIRLFHLTITVIPFTTIVNMYIITMFRFTMKTIHPAMTAEYFAIQTIPLTMVTIPPE